MWLASPSKCISSSSVAWTVEYSRVMFSVIKRLLLVGIRVSEKKNRFWKIDQENWRCVFVFIFSFSEQLFTIHATFDSSSAIGKVGDAKLVPLSFICACVISIMSVLFRWNGSFYSRFLKLFDILKNVLKSLQLAFIISCIKF